jgi:hypothetical protein
VIMSDNIFTIGGEDDLRTIDARPTSSPAKTTDMELLTAENVVDPQLLLGETSDTTDVDVPENVGNELDENVADSASRREMIAFLLLAGTTGSAICAGLL